MGFPEFPDEIANTIVAALERMETRSVEQRIRVLESKKDFIADGAWLTWEKDDLQFFLCETMVYKEGLRCKQERPEIYEEIGIYKEVGRFNGYVRFPSMPMLIPGYRGILTYVPVHGGITFFQDWWDGSVTYGFDTAHLVSTENLEIINDVGWMKHETESMARGIRIAARFEPYYLNAKTEMRKAVVLDRMGKFLPLELHSNTGALINAIFGEL